MAGARISGSEASVAVGTKSVAVKATLVLYLTAIGHGLAFAPFNVLVLSAIGVALTKNTASATAARAVNRTKRGRQLLHKYAAGVRTKLGPFVLSPQGKAAFAGFAAGLMVISAVPSNFHAQATILHGLETALPANNTTATVPPYSLNVSQFPSPDPIPQKGNFSLPRLGTTVFGGVPTYLLLSAGDAYRPESANISLRIAGSPVNAVNISLLENGTPLSVGTNLRTPGPPNVIHLPTSHLLLIPNYVVATSYAPDHGAGKVGANPAWLFVNFSGAFQGSASYFHVFNSRHPGSYQWNVSLASNMTQGIAESGIQARLSGSHLYLRTGTYSGLMAQERLENIVPGCSGVCLPPNVPIQWASPNPVPGYNFSITGDDLAVNGSVVMVAGSDSSSTLVSASQNGGTNWTAVGSATGASPRLALSQNGTLLSTLQGGQAYATVFGFQGQETAPVPLGPALNATPIWNSKMVAVLASGSFPATLGQNAVTVSGVACFVSSDGGASFAQFSPATYQSVARNLSLNSTDPIFNSIGDTSLATPGGEPGQLSAVAGGSQILSVFTSSVNGAVIPVMAVSSDGCAHWNSTRVALPPSGGSVMDPEAVLGPNGEVSVALRDDGMGTWSEDIATYSLSGHTLESTTRLPGSASTTAGAPALTVDPLDRPVLAWSVNGSSGSTGRYTGAFLSTEQVAAAWNTQVLQLQPADMAGDSASNLAALESALDTLGSEVSTGSYLQAVNDTALLFPRVTNASLDLANATFCSLTTGVCEAVHPPPVTEWVQNLSGVLAPDRYLEDYAILMFEALGVSVLSFPPGDPGVEIPPPSGGGGPTGSGYGQPSGGVSVSASETFINPITGELDLSWTFPTYTTEHEYTFPGSECPVDSLGHHAKTVTQGTYNVSQADSFSVGGGAGTGGKTFDTSASSMQIFLTNLPEMTSTTWIEGVTGMYTEVDERLDGCDETMSSSIVLPPVISPPSISSPALMGTITVALSMTPGQPGVGGSTELVQLLNTNDPAKETVALDWTNSMPAYVSPPPCLELGSSTPCPGSSVTGYAPSGTWGYVPPAPPASPPPAFESFEFTPPAPVGSASYTALASVSTDNATTWTLGNTIDVGPAPGSSAPLTAQLSCTFQVTAGPSLGSLRSTQQGAGTYVISWQSSVSSPGTISWTDLGFGGTQTVSGVGATGPTGGLYGFQATIRGLAAFDVYDVVVSNSVANPSSCATAVTSASLTIVTPATFSLQEQDLPYDSVTQEGGGAMLIWHIPTTVLIHSTYTSGFLVYDPLGDASALTQVPIPSLPYSHSFFGTFAENLTTLTPGTSYSIAMVLNFSEGGPIVAASNAPFSFRYLSDTSGDGLSDAEKALGWTVAYTDVDGNSRNEHATAEVNSYATNGLVNDLIEKKFGLDPRTMDTAGSHMLDTWNLTFQLPSATCPSGFECWDESSSPAYDPFSFAQIPSTWAVAPGDPSGPSPTNFTQGSAGFTGPDSSPWGSNQLWSYADLQVLQGLIPSSDGYLRGGLSDAPGVGPAITVWGKLSWGANPLSASTPADGVADGARVNPLHEVDLQVALPLGATIFNDLSTCSSFNRDAGYAIQLFVNQTSPSGAPEFQGYSNEGYFCPTKSDPPSLPPYTLTLPIANTEQTQSVQFQWIINNAQCQPGQSGCNSPYVLSKVPLDSSCDTVFSIAVDLVSAPYPDLNARPNYVLQAPKTCAPHQGYSTTMSIDAGAVPAGVKTQTFLWVPTDNSTLSNLPLGLQRYTGEQDFVVVTADVASGGLTSAEVPNPWGDPAYTQVTNNQYQLSAGQGLVSFVLPRAQFLNSPFGQAVMQDTVAQYPTTGPIPALPIVGGSLAGSSGLECYWQNRAVAPASFSPSSSPPDLTQVCTSNGYTFHGTVLGTTQIVRMVADTSGCSSGNCGGVPTNPALETSCTPASSCEAPALQASVTLNLSSASELNNLVAALLDNSTGGLNGTFQDFTQYLPSLGINSAVMSALPNVAVVDSGIFGIPVSLAVPPPPPPPSCNGLGCLWNAVSGVVGAFVGAIVNGIEGFAGAVWSAAQAATEFFEAAAAGLYAIGEDAVGAAVGALKAVGNALEAALAYLIRTIIQAAEDVVKPVFNAIVSGVNGYLEGVFASLKTFLSSAFSLFNGTGGVTLSDVYQSGENVFGAIFGLESVGKTLSQVLSAVQTILQPISQFLDFGALLADILHAVGAGGALSSLVGGSEAVLNKVGSAVGSALSWLAQAAMGGTPPSPEYSPGWLPPVTGVGSVFAQLAGVSFFGSILAGLQSQSGLSLPAPTPSASLEGAVVRGPSVALAPLVIIVLQGLAAGLLLISILETATGGLFATLKHLGFDTVLGIILTVVGIGLSLAAIFGQGDQETNLVFSVIVDVASEVLDLFGLEDAVKNKDAGKPALFYASIADFYVDLLDTSAVLLLA
ncbi:MAG: hypothetical protein KGI98_16005 [Euryarchaeota archaeon]|nr:hypothetical protein [Euryarchaeota archaeon]MDE1881857.1 hypothetical protein [Euryarchaeota archaeon]